MKILFDRISILFEDGKVLKNAYLSTDGDKISYIGEIRPDSSFDRVINGCGRLICPGLYNCHTHAAMSLFRGYGEDLPLQRWLDEKILPAEEKLTADAVYTGSMLSIAEMIKNGIVTFTDMYFFSDQTAKAAIESGIKANISRSVVSFDPDITEKTDRRFAEAKALYRDYHKSGDGRINIDMSLHAEYTVMENTCRYVSDYAVQNGLNMHIHLSETKREQEKGSAKRGMTPAAFFEKTGVFRANTTAAHCVYLTDDDMDILKNNKVNVAHNPVSNLKLGSGVMKLTELLDNKINVTLGTDGPASNNTLDIMKEAYIGSILQKGITGITERPKSREMMPLMTENAAIAQGRANCGKLKIGYKADIIMINLDSINVLPNNNLCDMFIYSANSSNILMTMVDGRILYENGEYKTIDIEKVKAEFKKVTGEYSNR